MTTEAKPLPLVTCHSKAPPLINGEGLEDCIPLLRGPGGQDTEKDHLEVEERNVLNTVEILEIGGGRRESGRQVVEGVAMTGTSLLQSDYVLRRKMIVCQRPGPTDQRETEINELPLNDTLNLMNRLNVYVFYYDDNIIVHLYQKLY